MPSKPSHAKGAPPLGGLTVKRTRRLPAVRASSCSTLLANACKPASSPISHCPAIIFTMLNNPPGGTPEPGAESASTTPAATSGSYPRSMMKSRAASRSLGAVNQYDFA
eukprot:CAMPEP_0115732996 /NCGR_PEP_ID=MMETSP0272-20121206/85423_1 /TAXON_ID=71861 /ORGANISM="Scrippsiella trochoidea, Strain CCMP3099" /LENGTH=108 /DNA_ID=CAMNT_0003176951 /DNA_START=219 /DNA_END=542 /DNA_ORIENTATION=+